ncbi:MAG: hypothetical protein AAFR71_12890 [Pseudomonadota bacterium]
MIISRDLLDEAVRRDIISANQRDRLVAFAVAADKPRYGDDATVDAVASGDEAMRLVGGGNDIFVTIGVVLVAAGLFFALTSVFGPQPMILFGILGVFLWGVAEFVTRQHRMRLSSTVLGIGFIACVTEILTNVMVDQFGLNLPENMVQLVAMRGNLGIAATIFFGTTIVAAIVYFWRFKVPIMAAVIAISTTGLVFSYGALFLYDGVTTGNIQVPLLEELPNLLRNALYIPLIAGLLIFGVGVMLDLHDRERITVWSDCAFWLHVVSAPLLVHPLFILSTGQEVVFGQVEPGTTATVLLAVLIFVFVFVALAIDRRSLLIPTLAYFGTLGIYYLVSSASENTGIPAFSLILLVVGALIMVFGAGWQRIRRLIITPMLPTSVLNKLPPIRVKQTA